MWLPPTPVFAPRSSVTVRDADQPGVELDVALELNDLLISAKLNRKVLILFVLVLAGNLYDGVTYDHHPSPSERQLCP
jgi:hypothetical protein